MMIKPALKYGILCSILFALSSTRLYAISAAAGFCEAGNQTVTFQGLISTTKVQRSFPSCTISVFISGTGTLATIYSDASSTPLANPFTANANGSWVFFAANGTYDVVRSGASIPTSTTSSVTVYDPASSQVLDCAAPRFIAANFGLRTINCLAAVPSTGGIADSRALSGNQTTTLTVQVVVNKTLLLPAGTMTCTLATNCFDANGGTIIGQGESSIIATNSTSAANTVVAVTADGAHLKDFTILTDCPAGQEAGQLSAIYFSKLTQLSYITIEGLYIHGNSVGPNNSIFGDVLIPAGIAHIRIRNNKIRGLQYGIWIGPFAGGPVNDDVEISDNDVEISAVGGYNAFWLARSITLTNCNGCRVHNNHALGGFNGIEIIGNLGNPSIGRPHMQSVIVSDNVIDNSPTVAQCDTCTFSGNVINMALRNPAWPSYDNPQVRLNSGLRPGAELSDNLNLSATGNSIKGAAGLGVDFGSTYSIFTGNTIISTGNGVNPNVYERSCFELTYVSSYVTVSGNTMTDCGGAGINQTVRESFSGVFGDVISDNIIKRTQTHGIHLHNVGQEGAIVNGNSVSDVNETGGLFDALNFSIDGGTGSISGLTVTNNITTGGRASITQSYVDAAADRTNRFFNNIGNSYTGSVAFNIAGITGGNTDGKRSTGTNYTLSGGVLDASTGLDNYTLGVAGTLTRIDSGTLGKTITIAVSTAGLTITNSANLMLNGAANAVVPNNGTITFICLNDVIPGNQAWQEVGRNFYDVMSISGTVTIATGKAINLGGVSIMSGTGAPVGPCGNGGQYYRSTGGPPNLYVCESGAWVGK